MPAQLIANSYGKAAVRLTKVRRRPGRHELTEVEVAIELTGDFTKSYLEGDNATIVATDTMKNTVYALAATHAIDSIEAFGESLAAHFVARNAHVDSGTVNLAETAWRRMVVDGAEHAHAFVAAGPHRRTARVRTTRDGAAFSAGIEGLELLKTTDSAFAGFIRDPWTTLAETQDRIFATRLTASWHYDARPANFDAAHAATLDAMTRTFATHKSLAVQQTMYAMGAAALSACPEIARIELEMPNAHRVPVDLRPFGLENRNEVFIPTAEPYGLIRATVGRA